VYSMPDEEVEEQEGTAVVRFNEDRSKCMVEIGDCEFEADTKGATTVFLYDSEADKHYALVIQEEDLEPDTVYELVELETVEEDEEEEPAEGTGTAT
jgi:hypothetical protein